MEKIKGEAVDRALDRAVFGTNDPDVIKDKVNKMADYLRFEASSLGRSLAGIRYRNYWSVERVAAEVGVDVTVWEAWESDQAVPGADELQRVLERLFWRWDLERFLKLREEALGSR